MRTVAVASILLAAAASVVHADADVKLDGGLVSIHAKASLPEILDRLQEKTGMKVIYDGPRPTQMVAVTIEDQTLVAALTSLLESHGVKFVIALNAAGTQVNTLLISTSASSAPARPAVTAHVEPYPNIEPFPSEEGVFNPPIAFEPPPDTLPAGVSMPSPPPGMPPMASAPGAPVISPFTPQGQGPIIIPPPGPAMAPPPPAMTPLPGRSTAEQAPWEK